MAYSVRYVNGMHLSQIKEEWESLQSGGEMTLFQTYSWFKMLLERYIPVDTKDFETIYALVESDGQPCMIAPLWIVKRTFRLINFKGVYLLGRCSFSDYLNFVYREFDGKAFDFLLKDLSKKYGVKHVTFEDLRETTSVYLHIIGNYRVSKNVEHTCVGLELPLSVDDYQNLLSKNSRQNIRTANNRLKKAGKELTFNYDDRQVDRDRCLEIRETKMSANSTKLPLWYKYKYRILNRLRYHFPSTMPIKYYSESKLMTAHDEEGNLRAFFCYGLDSDCKCIRVLAAGTDIEYARYSPGILLMHSFIQNAIREGMVKEVDFTRGDEKYKFSLGGQQRNNHTIKFKIA